MATDREIRSGLTAEYLRNILDYDSETGVFKWKVRRSSHSRTNMIAGTLIVTGYIRISINGNIHPAHRLAWLYVTGQWPTYQIDHKDRNPGNNRFNNLREVNQAQQNYNKVTNRKTSLPRGVRKLQNCKNKYDSRIKVGGYSIYIGIFNNPEEAHQAYLEAAERLGVLDFLPKPD